MPESPRFLYSRKRFSEAAAVLERIAKVNLQTDCTVVFSLDNHSDEMVPIGLAPDDDFAKQNVL